MIKMTTNVERGLAIFHTYYRIDENAPEKMPTSVVFNRISSDLNIARLSNAEMSEIIATLDLEKKSTTYSNYKNNFIERIARNQLFLSITPEFKKEFIKNYQHKDRIVINAFSNVVEKTEPDAFLLNRASLMHQIKMSNSNEELIDILKAYVEKHEPVGGIFSLIENKKRKEESVVRVNEPKTIHFL